MDEIEEYNPWGRPGGGAPIRSHSGKVVADFKKMAQVYKPSREIKPHDKKAKNYVCHTFSK